MKSGLALVLLSLVPVTSVCAHEDIGGVARILLASPSTTFSGKRVKENEVLKTIGALKTGADGGAKVKLAGNGVILEIAANSEINLVIPPSGDPTESIELVHGRVRVRVPKAVEGEKVDKTKPRFMLRHRKMTMGVRGTDFLATAEDDLGETELVVFTGEVEFANEKTNDDQTVDAGFWSGQGGRFGGKIEKPVKLSPAAIEFYERASRATPSFSIQGVPADTQNSASGH